MGKKHKAKDAPREIDSLNPSGRKKSISLDGFPDKCPLCNNGIDARYVESFIQAENVQVVFQCPLEGCYNFFVGYYTISPRGFDLMNCAPSSLFTREFSKEINGVSSEFVKIYNESHQAEKLGLGEICGPGYRKALEYLIKDYAISKVPLEEDKEMVIKSFLSTVIENHVSEENIKTTAKGAVWIGNDETHYYRKWTEMDLEDLKILIELTVRWIESEILTSLYKERMKIRTETK